MQKGCTAGHWLGCRLSLHCVSCVTLQHCIKAAHMRIHSETLLNPKCQSITVYAAAGDGRSLKPELVASEVPSTRQPKGNAAVLFLWLKDIALEIDFPHKPKIKNSNSTVRKTEKKNSLDLLQSNLHLLPPHLNAPTASSPPHTHIHELLHCTCFMLLVERKFLLLNLICLSDCYLCVCFCNLNYMATLIYGTFSNMHNSLVVGFKAVGVTDSLEGDRLLGRITN